jgi:predicted O-methyltransferase YrrM
MIGNALLHYIGCYLGFSKPHSQSTRDEQDIIARYATGSKCAVEIGVYEGVNTINIASRIDSNGMLYAIDPFFKGKLGICYYERIAKNAVEKNKLSHKIKFIPQLSSVAAQSVPFGIDFIFIDGEHSVEGIKKDWELYSQKVIAGGVMLLHDTRVPAHDPGVSELGSYKYFESVIKADPRFEIIDSVDSLTVLRKK